MEKTRKRTRVWVAAALLTIAGQGCSTVEGDGLRAGPELAITNRGSSPVMVAFPGGAPQRVYPGRTVCAPLPLGGPVFSARVSAYAGDNRAAWTPKIDPRQSWTIEVGRTGVLVHDVLSLEPTRERCMPIG